MATRLRSVSPAHCLLVLITSFGGIGCNSWHVEPLAPAAVVASKQPSQIRVTRADNSRVVLDNPVVRGDSLSGHFGRHADISIPLASVQRVETPRLNVVAMGAISFGMLAITYVTKSR